MAVKKILDSRPISLKDSWRIFLHARDDVSCHKQPLISTNPESEIIIKRWIQQHESNPSSHHLAITLDEQLVGISGLSRIHRFYDAEVFYWIASPFRGLGMAKPIVYHLQFLAKEFYSLSSLYAYIDDENKVSTRMLEDSGFSPVMNSSDTFFDQTRYVKQLDNHLYCSEYSLPLLIDTSYRKNSISQPSLRRI
ncbi:MAG: GNAT family N-acetyltransferase [Candidatus Woesearchaeota archaeon]